MTRDRESRQVRRKYGCPFIPDKAAPGKHLAPPLPLARP